MKEMKGNNAFKHLDIAIANIKAARDILEQKYKAKKQNESEKVNIEIKIKNPFDGVEISEKDLEEIRKDLEEIINDFTRE